MINLKTPLINEDVTKLVAGDIVSITGKMYTGRDQAHKRLVDLIKAGKPLPFDLKGQLIYFVGPTPAKDNMAVGSAGPTSSYRMDPYSPYLMELGLKGMIGKGPRSEKFKKAVTKYNSVYFVAVGGAGALISKSIKKSKVIAYDDLGTEAIREIYVENFPAIVAYDTHGNDLIIEGKNKYKK